MDGWTAVVVQLRPTRVLFSTSLSGGGGFSVSTAFPAGGEISFEAFREQRQESNDLFKGKQPFNTLSLFYWLQAIGDLEE